MTKTALGTGSFRLLLVVATFGCARPQSSERSSGTETVQSALMTDVEVMVADTDGTAEAGVTVFAQNSAGAQGGSANTDGSGRAILSVEGGAYKFGAMLGDTTFWSGADGSCDTSTCSSAAITVQKPVTVTVINQRGDPQPAAVVVAEDTADNQVSFRDTDGQGQAQVWVSAGAYSFYVIVDGTLFRSGPDGHCAVPGCTAASSVSSMVSTVVISFEEAE